MVDSFELAFGRGALFGIGVLLFVDALLFAGNKIAPNYLSGVRTKWALADSEVWYEINRKALPVIMFAAIAFIVLAILPSAVFISVFTIVSVILLAGSLFVCHQSKILYEQRHGTTRVVRVGWFNYRPPTSEER